MKNLKDDKLTFVIYFAWSLLHLTSRVGSAWIKTHWLLSLFTASDEVQHSYNLNWGAIDLFTTPNEVQYSFQQGAILRRCVFKRNSMYYIEFTLRTLKAEKLHTFWLKIYQRQKDSAGKGQSIEILLKLLTFEEKNIDWYKKYKCATLICV